MKKIVLKTIALVLAWAIIGQAIDCGVSYVPGAETAACLTPKSTMDSVSLRMVFLRDLPGQVPASDNPGQYAGIILGPADFSLFDSPGWLEAMAEFWGSFSLFGKIGLIIAIVYGFFVYKRWKKSREITITVRENVKQNGQLNGVRNYYERHVKNASVIEERHISKISLLINELIADKDNKFSFFLTETQKEERTELFNQLNSVISDIRGDIFGFMKNTNLTELQRRALSGYLSLLQSARAYGLACVWAMDSMSNIEGLSGYILPPWSFWEITGAMAIVRAIFGMTGVAMISKRNLRMLVPYIAQFGNQIIPGLYPPPEALNQDLEEYLGLCLSGIGGPKLGWRRFWRWRSMYQRAIAFLSSVLMFKIMLPEWRNIDFYQDWWRIVFSLTPFILHWIFFVAGMTGNAYRSKLKALSPGGEDIAALLNAGEHLKQNLLDIEYGRIQQAGNLQLREADPPVNIILVMAGNAPGRVDMLRNLFAQTENVLWRGDVPVVFMHGYGEGSGMSMLKAFEHINLDEPAAEFMARLRRDQLASFMRDSVDLPHLQNKKTKDLRIGVLMLDNEDENAITGEVPLRPNGMNRPLKTFELQLLNIYKASMSWWNNNSGGAAILTGDRELISPIEEEGDITLVSSWAAYPQIKAQSAGLLLVDALGRIKKFFARFNHEKLGNYMVKEMMPVEYDLSNPDKQQMLAFTGTALISFRNQEKIANFIALLGALRDEMIKLCPPDQTMALEDGNSPKVPTMYLAEDILVLLIMLARGEKIFTYWAARNLHNLEDREREFYFNWFSLAERFCRINEMPEFKAFVPYLHQTLYRKHLPKSLKDGAMNSLNPEERYAYLLKQKRLEAHMADLAMRSAAWDDEEQNDRPAQSSGFEAANYNGLLPVCLNPNSMLRPDIAAGAIEAAI